MQARRDCPSKSGWLLFELAQVFIEPLDFGTQMLDGFRLYIQRFDDRSSKGKKERLRNASCRDDERIGRELVDLY